MTEPAPPADSRGRSPRVVAIVGAGMSGLCMGDALEQAGMNDFTIEKDPNRRYSPLTRQVFRRLPALNRLAYRGYQATLEATFGVATTQDGAARRAIAAACRANLRLAVRDPDLRRRLTPDYEPMCKRLVMSGGFYRAMQKPGVQLVTELIERVEPRGIVTADGALHHSPIGNHSLVAIAETQCAYVVRWLERMRAGEVVAVAPTAEATARFNADLRAAMPATVWVTGCSSWYIGADGVPELWPWSPARHRAMLREPEPGDFATSASVG